MRFASLLAERATGAKPGPLSIAFLGDSVTHGCFEIFNEGATFDFDAVYHAQLRRLFAAAFPALPIQMINAGVSGDTVQMGLARLERDVLPFSPDLTVVCFGLNNAPQGEAGLVPFRETLVSIFRVLAAHRIEALFMTPNMMNTRVSPNICEAFREFAGITAQTQNSGMMDRYMDAARGACVQEGVVLCDCYKKWKGLAAAGADPDSMLVNALNHPTREMHGLFASSLFDTILFGG